MRVEGLPDLIYIEVWHAHTKRKGILLGPVNVLKNQEG